MQAFPFIPKKCNSSFPPAPTNGHLLLQQMEKINKREKNGKKRKRKEFWHGEEINAGVPLAGTQQPNESGEELITGRERSSNRGKDTSYLKGQGKEGVWEVNEKMIMQSNKVRLWISLHLFDFSPPCHFPYLSP